MWNSEEENTEWVLKVFRTLYSLHSLFHCSHFLKSKKFILFLINVSLHFDRKKHKWRHFCKCIKKEKPKYHTVISWILASGCKETKSDTSKGV